jgi:hypothetical protein
LKTKAFILEKFLDTAFRGTIRFLAESSDWVLSNPPLELFSLERKAAWLPGGLSISIQLSKKAHGS